MATFGSFSVVLALTFCFYALFALFYGAKSGRRDLVKSGEHAVYVMFAFVTLSVAALEVLLMRSDFDRIRRGIFQPRSPRLLQARVVVGRSEGLALVLVVDPHDVHGLGGVAQSAL